MYYYKKKINMLLSYEKKLYNLDRQFYKCIHQFKNCTKIENTQKDIFLKYFSVYSNDFKTYNDSERYILHKIIQLRYYLHANSSIPYENYTLLTIESPTTTYDDNTKLDILSSIQKHYEELKELNPKLFSFVKIEKIHDGFHKYNYVTKKYFHFGSKRKRDDEEDDLVLSPDSFEEVFANLPRRRSPPTTTNATTNQQQQRPSIMNNVNRRISIIPPYLLNNVETLESIENDLENVMQGDIPNKYTSTFRIGIIHLLEKIYSNGPNIIVYKSKSDNSIYKFLRFTDDADLKIKLTEVLIQKLIYQLLKNQNNLCKIPQVYNTYIYDNKNKNERTFIIHMENAGDTFVKIINNRKLTKEERTNLCIETIIKINKTLEYIRRFYDFIHCDLKTNNFCIKNGEIYLIDFGMSRIKLNSDVIVWSYPEIQNNSSEIYHNDILFLIYHLFATQQCQSTEETRNNFFTNSFVQYMEQTISKYYSESIDCKNFNAKQMYFIFYTTSEFETNNLENELLSL